MKTLSELGDIHVAAEGKMITMIFLKQVSGYLGRHFSILCSLGQVSQ